MFLQHFFSFKKVDLTENGVTMMKNFLYEIAGLTGTFTMKSREENCIKYIRETVSSNKVLVSLKKCAVT